MADIKTTAVPLLAEDPADNDLVFVRDTSAARFKGVERKRFPRWPDLANTSTNRAILATDRGKTIRLTGSSARTFTLPDITGGVVLGWDVWIVNGSGAALTVDGHGSDTVDGSATLTVAAGAAVRLQAVSSAAWVSVTPASTGGGGGGVTVAAAAPANPSEGDQWWDTTGSPDAGLKVRVGSSWASADAGIRQADADARYVRVTGGTMTGRLTVGAASGTPLEVDGQNAGASTIMRITTPTAGGKAFGSNRQGETADWLQVSYAVGGTAKPGIAIGLGSAARDTNLYREGSNHLRASGVFTCSELRLTGTVLTTRSNLGLGTAAVASTGTTSGTVALLGTGGRFAVARMGSGTTSTSTFLRGDGAWASPPIGGGGLGETEVDNRIATWARATSPSGEAPLLRGGTGSGTAAGARTNLGLGTAATKDTGTVSGNVGLLGTGGRFGVARLGSGTGSSTKFLRGDGAWSDTLTSTLKVTPASNAVALFLDATALTTQTPFVFNINASGNQQAVWMRRGSTDQAFLTIDGDLGGSNEKPGIALGPGGSTVRDTNIYREGANHLRTGGVFTASELRLTGTVSTTRSNLGLGTAAVKDTGTTSGDVGLLGTGGRFEVARLGSGTTGSTRFLRGDGAWSNTLTSTLVIEPFANTIALHLKCDNLSNQTPLVIEVKPTGNQTALYARRGSTDTAFFQLDGNIGGSNNKPGISFGPGGNTPQDTRLYRDNVATLQTNGKFRCSELQITGTVGTTRTNLGLGTAAVKATGTTTGTIALLSTSGRFPTTRLGSGIASNTTFLRGDQTWTTTPVGLTLGSATPKAPGPPVVGVALSASHEDHGHPLPPAAGTAHGVKRVSNLPTVFDEAVLYLTHPYRRGVAADLNVTPGEDTGRYGWSDGSLFESFGRLADEDVSPGPVIAIFGDPADRSVEFVVLNNTHLAGQVDRVEVNGTLYSLNALQHVWGNPALVLAAPPTGLPTLASNTAFTVNLRLAGGSELYFNNGATEVVPAGMYGWTGAAYEKLIPGTGGGVDLPFKGFRVDLPAATGQIITTSANDVLKFRSTDIDFDAGDIADETNPTTTTVIVTQTVKVKTRGYYHVSCNLQFDQTTSAARRNLRVYMILVSATGVELQRVELDSYNRGLSAPASVRSSVNGVGLWRILDTDIIKVQAQTESDTFTGTIGGSGSSFWLSKVPEQTTAEAGAAGQGDGAIHLTSTRYRMTYFARAALQPADPPYVPTTSGISPTPADESIWQSADPNTGSSDPLWLATMEYLYHSDLGTFETEPWTVVLFGGFRVRYANHFPESESGWHTPPIHENDVWMEVRLANGEWGGPLRIAEDPFGDVQWQPFLGRNSAYGNTADQVVTRTLYPPPAIYFVQELLFRIEMFSSWGSDGASPVVLGRGQKIWSKTSSEEALPIAPYGSAAAKDKYAFRVQATRQHGIVGLVLDSDLAAVNDFNNVQTTFWVRLVSAVAGPTSVGSVQIFGFGLSYNRCFLTIATRGR